MAKPIQLAHVVLRTTNFQKMMSWYLTVLEASITFSNEMLSFITYDEEHHRVAFINIPDLQKPKEGAYGVDHFAFTYSSLGDLLSNYSRLKNDGIEPFWCINHGPTTSMYYRDPDGNQIELQVENFDTVKESTEFFYSDDFKKNPIGVDFNPDDLLQRLNNGESEKLLKQRPSIGARGMDDGVPLK